MQVPTQENIKYVPPADEIADDSPDQWALYPGNWGAGDLFLDSQRRLICYYDNFTRTGALRGFFFAPLRPD